jgi:hypothetical protein
MADQPGDHSRRIAALDELQKEGKGVRAHPSALRLYIRDNYPSLVAARDRGVSWQQIAEVMAAAGVRAPDGSPLTWRRLAVLFHAERYDKDPKRKRKAARRRATRREAGVSTSALPDAPSAPPPVPPSPPVAAGDPDLARRLSGIRTLTPPPPRDLGAGWRGGPRTPKEKQDDGDGEN